MAIDLKNEPFDTTMSILRIMVWVHVFWTQFFEPYYPTNFEQEP
jgi:hypothetical protein